MVLPSLNSHTAMPLTPCPVFTPFRCLTPYPTVAVHVPGTHQLSPPKNEHMQTLNTLSALPPCSSLPWSHLLAPTLTSRLHPRHVSHSPTLALHRIRDPSPASYPFTLTLPFALHCSTFTQENSPYFSFLVHFSPLPNISHPFPGPAVFSPQFFPHTLWSSYCWDFFSEDLTIHPVCLATHGSCFKPPRWLSWIFVRKYLKPLNIFSAIRIQALNTTISSKVLVKHDIAQIFKNLLWAKR